MKIEAIIMIVFVLFVIGIFILDKFVIQKLKPTNKFKVWWRNNVIDEVKK